MRPLALLCLVTLLASIAVEPVRLQLRQRSVPSEKELRFVEGRKGDQPEGGVRHLAISASTEASDSYAISVVVDSWADDEQAAEDLELIPEPFRREGALSPQKPVSTTVEVFSMPGVFQLLGGREWLMLLAQDPWEYRVGVDAGGTVYSLTIHGRTAATYAHSVQMWQAEAKLAQRAALRWLLALAALVGVVVVHDKLRARSLAGLYFELWGRADRTSLWLYSVPLQVALVPFLYPEILGYHGPSVWPHPVALALRFWSGAVVLNLYAKRCLDIGRSRWFLLLLFVPVVNLWPVAELLFRTGTEPE